MKKLLSSILAGVMLFSSIGAISVFADEPTASNSSTVLENTVENSAEIQSENVAPEIVATADQKEGAIKTEPTQTAKRSFWQRNKGKVLMVAGGALVVASMYFWSDFYDRYLRKCNLEEASTLLFSAATKNTYVGKILFCKNWISYMNRCGVKIAMQKQEDIDNTVENKGFFRGIAEYFKGKDQLSKFNDMLGYCNYQLSHGWDFH